MAILASADLATWLGVADNATIQNLALVADAWVKRYCGRDFEVADRTEYPRGYGRTELVEGYWRSHIFMREWPIVSVAGVWIDAAGAFPSTSALDASYILIDDRKLILLADVPEGSRVVKVTYNAGYASNALPADLVYAAKQIATGLYRQGSSERMKSESMGAYSYTRFEKSIDPIVAQMLIPFRA